MGRAGYSEDVYDYWAHIRWRGAVASAERGRRGQTLLKDLLSALDSMAVKRLIEGDLKTPDGEVCALGALGVARYMNVDSLDPKDHECMAKEFAVAKALIREIEFQNDEGTYYPETSEERWARVRQWVASKIRTEEVGDA